MSLSIIIIVLAIAMIVGPIMLMQPTQQQRRDAARRQKAADLGLRVHLQPPPKGTDLPPEIKQVAMYCLPWSNSQQRRSNWCLIRRSYSHGLHFSGCWDWDEPPAPARDLSMLTEARLAQLNADVVAVAAGTQGLCCYWLERGELNRVDEMATWLKELAAEMP